MARVARVVGKALRLLGFTAVTAGLLGVGQLATSAQADTPVQKKPQTAPLLFALNSSSGSLTPIPNRTGVYQLTLDGVDPQTVWFTDRPARQADTVDTATGLSMVGFGDKGEAPPNAVLTFHGPDATHGAVPLTLEQPGYDVAGATLHFQATLLRKPDSGLAGFDTRLDHNPPSAFGAVSVFIDDADAPVAANGQPLAQTKAAPNGKTYIYLSFSDFPNAWGDITFDVKPIYDNDDNCVELDADSRTITLPDPQTSHAFDVGVTTKGSLGTACGYQHSRMKWKISSGNRSTYVFLDSYGSANAVCTGRLAPDEKTHRGDGIDCIEQGGNPPYVSLNHAQ